MNKSPKVKLFLKFKFKDGSFNQIEIKKVTSLKIPIDRSKLCLHIDKIDDGYLMVMNEEFWNVDNQKLIDIEVIKEEEGK